MQEGAIRVESRAVLTDKEQHGRRDQCGRRPVQAQVLARRQLDNLARNRTKPSGLHHRKQDRRKVCARVERPSRTLAQQVQQPAGELAEHKALRICLYTSEQPV